MLFLYILGKIILYILLVLLIVLLAVLMIPFKYYFSGAKYDSTRLEGSVVWLFGGLKMRFNYISGSGYNLGMTFLGFKKKFDNKKSKSQSKPNKQEKKDDYKKENNKPTYSYFTYEVIKKGLQTVLKMLNHCKPSQFYIETKVGFDDPMYTGLLCGIQNAGYAILDKYQIHLKTTFEDEVLEGNFIIGGSIQIFYLILVAVEFVITKPFRSILFKNIKVKIKRRLKRWRIVSILVKT